MRISGPRLLLLIAILIVILVELRTVLAFFEIEVSFTTTIVVGIVVIGVLVFWAVGTGANGSDE